MITEVTVGTASRWRLLLAVNAQDRFLDERLRGVNRGKLFDGVLVAVRRRGNHTELRQLLLQSVVGEAKEAGALLLGFGLLDGRVLPQLVDAQTDVEQLLRLLFIPRHNRELAELAEEHIHRDAVEQLSAGLLVLFGRQITNRLFTGRLLLFMAHSFSPRVIGVRPR